jgi:bifunctional polynucleotide phosphatase/kinase
LRRRYVRAVVSAQLALSPEEKRSTHVGNSSQKNPTVPTVLDDDGFVVHPKGLMHRVHPKNKPSVKVLALDLDNTLIRRAKDSNAKGGLPDSKEDFELYNDSVRAVLSDHAARGYQLVVFSNQGAIKTAMGGITSYIVRGVCDNVGKALGEDVPLNFMLATADPKAKGDEYRKPKTGMWDKFVELMNDGQAPDLAECTYVGDAAGRPQDLVTSGINDGDRKFAEGVGIAFKTPEEIFGAPGAGKMENQDLGNAFFELANAFVLKTDDEKKHFRARALRNAGSAIKLHEQVITDVDQVKGVKGIGKGSQDLIREFLDTGKLADIEKIASGEWAKERAEKATTEQKEISKAAEVGQSFL